MYVTLRYSLAVILKKNHNAQLRIIGIINFTFLKYCTNFHNKNILIAQSSHIKKEKMWQRFKVQNRVQTDFLK